MVQIHSPDHLITPKTVQQITQQLRPKHFRFPVAQLHKSNPATGSRVPLWQPAYAELLRYFRVREAWEGKQFAGLKHEDVQFLHDATKAFRAERFQELFRAWNAGTVTESGLHAAFEAQGNSCEIGFDAYVVRPQGFLTRLTGVTG